MFEIGNSLHEARVRQGVDLPTAESATKIRAKYLKALEEEDFELLPAQTYVRGFLRTYADFLGLDGQLYVDEYNSRFVVGDEELRPLRPRRSSVRPERRGGGLESSVVLVTLAAIGLVAALVIVAWKSGDSRRLTPTTAPAVSTRGAATPERVRVLLTARGGDSVVEAHAGSSVGRLLFQGTLLDGKSMTLSGRRLWLKIASPRNVVLRVNGHHVPLRRASPAVVDVAPGLLRAG